MVQVNEHEIFWNFIRQASTFWQFSFQYAFNSLPLMHILTYFVYFVLTILQYLQRLPLITINRGLTFDLALK